MQILLFAVAVAACSVATVTLAADYKVGAIDVIGPWSRATPKGAQTAIGYMSIKNTGSERDRLIAGSVEVAGRFELHAMTMDDGISKMRSLPGVDIKPGQTIEFKPGGSHAMFVELKHPLTAGDRIKGTLVFEHAGTVQIEYDVAGIGAQQRPMQTDHIGR